MLIRYTDKVSIVYSDIGYGDTANSLLLTVTLFQILNGVTVQDRDQGCVIDGLNGDALGGLDLRDG